MSFSRLLCVVTAVLLSSFAPLKGTAAPFDASDILVSVGMSVAGSSDQINTVYEFNRSGSPVQSIPFNYDGGSYPKTEYLRDIIVAPNGNLYGYNGTFSPYLTGYSPATNTFTNTTTPGWNTFNQISYGGIGAYRNDVFVTDFNLQDADGIVRFDTSNGTSTRFGVGTSYVDLSVGLDGKVYGVPYSSRNLNVFDPTTMSLLRTVTLAISGAVAVDQLGRIFVASGSTIYRLSSSGALEATLNTGLKSFFGFGDIDVDANGDIIASDDFGNIVLTDTSLSSFTSFQAVHRQFESSWTVFVSFAKPAAIPEIADTGSMLLLAAAVLLVCSQKAKLAGN